MRRPPTTGGSTSASSARSGTRAAARAGTSTRRGETRRCGPVSPGASGSARAGSTRRPITCDALLLKLAKPLGFRQALQLLEGVVLDLADALPGHAEGAPDLLEREWLLARQAVAQLDHLALAFGQGVERAPDVSPLHDHGRALERALGRLVLDEVAER